MGRELFKVLGTLYVPDFGQVEHVTGYIGDVVFSRSKDFKASCYRCCFLKQHTLCGKPLDLPSCIVEEFGNESTFYRRKTAENISKS